MSTTLRQPAKRRAVRLTRTSRFAAIATASMAGSALGELAGGSTHGYSVLLVGALALGALVAAGRMWQRNCFESRFAVVVLSGLIVAGQAMVAFIGSPSTGSVSWTPAATMVVVFAFLAVALVVADARERPVRPEHPYAL
ncbi:hypothetical protein [Nocardioides marmorisolisilvae]|uniref:Uncharacterized protein n=1 Tax=Nocardioides marmorisolisilvae TaxID=1542737 RepID=A0A3N0DSB6_9ACTN|nr:hypothetical protein [Nocardioides marmorisolisilvae]RNL78510.1 hypothetical protein EFL95_05285 [Nocardioides marmorisolisilvae]